MKEIVEEKFKEIFGTEGRFKTYFVPERTEIIGDGDQKIPTTRRKKGVYATIRKREDQILNFYSVDFSEAGIISISLDNIFNNENNSWVKYPREIVTSLKEKGYELEHGFDIVYYENIKKDIETKLPPTLKELTIIILADMFGLKLDNEEIILLGTSTDEERKEEKTYIPTGEKLQIL